MDERIRHQIPYAPRAAFVGFHNTTRRWSIICAHRRSGKTVASINKLIKAAAECTLPEPRFGYVAPYLSQAKEIAWNYLKRYSEPIWAEPPNESELRLTLFNGATIRLHGSDNPDRLRGAYFDGVVMDEFATQRTSVWGEIVREPIAHRTSASGSSTISSILAAAARSGIVSRSQTMTACSGMASYADELYRFTESGSNRLLLASISHR